MELSDRIAREWFAEDEATLKWLAETDHAVSPETSDWLKTQTAKLSAIIARHLTSQWQPIESAPRNWEWFLAYSEPEREYAVYRIASSGLQPDDWIPTHWMPLPAPPDATQLPDAPATQQRLRRFRSNCGHCRQPFTLDRPTVFDLCPPCFLNGHRFDRESCAKCAAQPVAGEAPPLGVLDPIEDIVGRIWQLTAGSRDGWSRLELRGLIEQLVRNTTAASTPAIEPAEDAKLPKGYWPTLLDRSNGVKGHYCIGRLITPYEPYWEFWNKGRWTSAGEVFIGILAAQKALDEIRATTTPAASEEHFCGSEKERELWLSDERPDDQDNPCSVCGKRMPLNPCTAIFGCHYECRNADSLDPEIQEAQRLYEQTTQGFWERDPNNASQIVVLRKRGETNIKDNIVFEDQKARNVDLEFTAAAHNLWPKLVARAQPHSIADCIARVAKVEELERGEKTDAN